MNRIMNKSVRVLLPVFVLAALPTQVVAKDFAPPTMLLVDKMGVDLASGQVTQRLDTLAIGGSMGLSHNISAYTNEFSMTGFRGYQDKFYAVTRTKVIGLAVQGYGYLDVLNVHDFEDSVDFMVKVNNQRVNVNTEVTSGYTYEALRDERHTLKVATDGYLVWTKPNGTVVRLKRSPGAKPADTAILETVTYPNNFTITVESPHSVISNTGFQLKYIYVDDHSASSSASSSSLIPASPTNLVSRLIANCVHTASWNPVAGATYYRFRETDISKAPITTTNISQNVICASGQPESNKPKWVQACNSHGCSPEINFQGVTPELGAGATNIPAENPLLWSQRNPKYIQAINTAQENCGTDNQLCAAKWPKATFTWPSGMPRKIFLGESVFKVADALGEITEFHFRSYDLAYIDENFRIEGRTPGERFSPRLIGVKPASSSQLTLKYTYKNITAPYNAGDTSWDELVSDAGLVTSATNGDAATAYDIGAAYYGSDTKNSAGGSAGGIFYAIKRSNFPGTLNEVKSVAGYMHYEGNNFRNFPDSYTPLGGMSESYEYTRGNLTKITSGTEVAQAEYAASCDQTNYKYCNKPIWVTDRSGKNITYYQYHAASGEVERVTLPPDSNNVSAVTRYTYAQKQASYYHKGVKKSGSPIWLKVAEKTCIQTATIGDACAGGPTDEVTTAYEYDSDNLWLTGMTVTAVNSANSLVTKRTCYEYDAYGNRIGETQPLAGLTSCNP